jgi:TPR repeat protein
MREWKPPPSKGDAYAQHNLVVLYVIKGQGVPQDYVHTYVWYKLGAANGGKSGAVLRDELAIRMSSEQISAAQKLARASKPNPMNATPCPSKRPPSPTCGRSPRLWKCLNPLHKDIITEFRRLLPVKPHSMWMTMLSDDGDRAQRLSFQLYSARVSAFRS